MKTPKCSECGVGIVKQLTDAGEGADWICLKCSGATLDDFLDLDNDREPLRKCYGCDQTKLFAGEFCDQCLEAWKEEGPEVLY